MGFELPSTYHTNDFANGLEEWARTRDPQAKAANPEVYVTLRRIVEEIRYAHGLMIHAEKYVEGDHGPEAFLEHIAEIKTIFGKHD